MNAFWRNKPKWCITGCKKEDHSDTNQSSSATFCILKTSQAKKISGPNTNPIVTDLPIESAQTFWLIGATKLRC